MQLPATVVFAAIMPPDCRRFCSSFGDIAAVRKFLVSLTWNYTSEAGWYECFSHSASHNYGLYDKTLAALAFSLSTLIGSGIPRLLFN